MHPADQTRLQRLFRREGRSLLQYVRDAFPWTANGGERLARLQRLIDEERLWLGEFTRYLQRRRVTPPYLGAYPMEFTTLNFVALDHLLPMLVRFQREAIPTLEADAAALADADARATVERLVAMKKDHLKTLEELAAPAKPAAVT
jgi:rubrerythrin